MTHKPYCICVTCEDARIEIGHKFDAWWGRDGRFIDPVFKRRELAVRAFLEGYSAGRGTEIEGAK